MTPEKLDEILDRNGRQASALLAILQDVQAEDRWLSPAALADVAAGLSVPRTRVWKLATFFKSLSLTPRGEHVCQICTGTTCHVRGAPRLVDKVKLEIGIEPGATTADMKFTLETVGCVGACALGPVVVMDGRYHSNVSADGMGRIVRAAVGGGARGVAEPQE